jgi:hypothetical protein
MIQSEYKPGSRLFVMYHYMATVVKTGAPVDVPPMRSKKGGTVRRHSLSAVVAKIKIRHFPLRHFSLAEKDGGRFILSLVKPE